EPKIHQPVGQRGVDVLSAKIHLRTRSRPSINERTAAMSRYQPSRRLKLSFPCRVCMHRKRLTMQVRKRSLVNRHERDLKTSPYFLRGGSKVLPGSRRPLRISITASKRVRAAFLVSS